MAKWDLSKLPQGRKPLDDDWFAKQLHPSPEAIVRAALERAAKHAEHPRPWWRRVGRFVRPEDIAYDIRSLASDHAEVAAIIKKAGEDRG